MTPKNTELIKQVLERIEKRQGYLTAHAVVNEARDETSPLHAAFVWDDNEAGELWRLHEARRLINTYKVEIEGHSVQQWFNVRVQTETAPIRGYFPVMRVMNDDAMYDQIVQKILNEVEYLRVKYSHIHEIHELINEDKLSELKEKRTTK